MKLERRMRSNGNWEIFMDGQLTSWGYGDMDECDYAMSSEGRHECSSRMGEPYMFKLKSDVETRLGMEDRLVRAHQDVIRLTKRIKEAG
jgi:hypothetical protein